MPNEPDVKTQVVERLKQANNILVTVSANPSVDQLAATIGLTLVFNKIGKHGTAVFSGEVPSTIEFLKPEETLEKNTDSLRDFIIALDKSKADKLRYKVEDQFVKIFITPYRTSIDEKDLEFSQGDFNVDVVVALGVQKREDLDQAITAHGRILHDATIIDVNTVNGEPGMGALNWVNTNASSLSEMAVELAEALKPDVLDAQMATAFLTGIVAETKRFGNDKARPETMNTAGKLMAAGASQQLVAEKLEEEEPPAPEEDKPEDDKPPEDKPPEEPPQPPEEPPKPPEEPPKPPEEEKKEEEPEEEEPAKDGTVSIDLNGKPDGESQEDEDDVNKIDIDHEGNLHNQADTTNQLNTVDSTINTQLPPSQTATPSMVMEAPALGGKLTANSEPDHLKLDPSTDPFFNTSAAQPPLLNRDAPSTVASSPVPDIEQPPAPDKSLDDLRNAVNQAVVSGPDSYTPAPIAALGSSPMISNLNMPPLPAMPTNDLPSNLVPPVTPPASQTDAPQNPSAPPPVPPPIL